jgi:hypothetical protein
MSIFHAASVIARITLLLNGRGRGTRRKRKDGTDEGEEDGHRDLHLSSAILTCDGEGDDSLYKLVCGRISHRRIWR